MITEIITNATEVTYHTILPVVICKNGAEKSQSQIVIMVDKLNTKENMEITNVFLAISAASLSLVMDSIKEMRVNRLL